MKRIHLKNEPNLLAKYKAFPYQKEAFEAIKDNEYAAVFHEQGLGKTKIAIDLLLYWLENTLVDTVLIVTKKQLVRNWENEFTVHTYIKPSILTSDKTSNYYVFSGPARVVVANFETLKVEKDRFLLYLKTRNVAIIIDESAKLKNPETDLTKTYFLLAPYFVKRVIMTGTPVANRPYDIWAQIYFLDQGKSLGTDFEEFKKNTDLSNKLGSNPILQNEFERTIEQIHEKIKCFTVRETKDSGIITLPDKVYIREEVRLGDKQADFYQRIREDLKIEVMQNGQLVVDDSAATVKRLLRLIQAVSNPRLVDDSFSGESAKEAVLFELVQRIVSNGEKCIVWTAFIDNVNYFYQKYRDYGCVRIHGGMKISDRNRSVEKFKLDDYNILFATPASAKEGLTLTMANHVIFYDRSFSLDDYLQAQDRIHRISQKRTCYIHNIIANDTIDEWIDILLEAKQNAAKLSQGDITIQEYRKTADYSFGEIVRTILQIGQEDMGNG